MPSGFQSRYQTVHCHCNSHPLETFFFLILGFLKFYSDIPYCGPFHIGIHCSGDFLGPFDMAAHGLQFWKIFLCDFIDNFLHSVFSSLSGTSIIYMLYFLN